MSSTSPGRPTRAIHPGGASTVPPPTDRIVVQAVQPSTVRRPQDTPPPDQPQLPKWQDPTVSVHEGGLKPSGLFGSLKGRLARANKNTVRSLTRKDRLAYEDYWREAEIKRLISRLRYLGVTEGLQPTVSILNFKSGAKSTTTLYVGSCIAEYTRKKVVAITASANTATATLSRMAGVHAQPVSKFAADLSEDDTYRELSRSVQLNKHGLGIVGEFDPASEEDEPDYTIEQFRRVVRAHAISSDVILLDHGNDNPRGRGDIIPYAALDYSDVLIFTAKASEPISETTMRGTWHAYARDPRSAMEREALASEDYQSGRLCGLTISTANKVQESLVVHSGVRDHHRMNLLEESDEVMDESVNALRERQTRRSMIPWLGVQFDVPFEPYIATKVDDRYVPPCDLDKISREALLSYLRIAVGVFESHVRVTGFVLRKGNPHTIPAGPYGDSYEAIL